MSKQWEKETTNDGMTTGHLLPKWKNPIIKNGMDIICYCQNKYRHKKYELNTYIYVQLT